MSRRTVTSVTSAAHGWTQALPARPAWQGSTTRPGPLRPRPPRCPAPVAVPPCPASIATGADSGSRRVRPPQPLPTNSRRSTPRRRPPLCRPRPPRRPRRPRRSPGPARSNLCSRPQPSPCRRPSSPGLFRRNRRPVRRAGCAGGIAACAARPVHQAGCSRAVVTCAAGPVQRAGSGGAAVGSAADATASPVRPDDPARAAVLTRVAVIVGRGACALGSARIAALACGCASGRGTAADRTGIAACRAGPPGTAKQPVRAIPGARASRSPRRARPPGLVRTS